MDTKELKFVLKLLGCENYRTPISKVDLGKGIKPAERDRICRALSDRQFVAHVREVSRFRIEPAGKTALEQPETMLTSEQQLVLKACEKAATTAGSVSKLSPADRQTVIQELEQKGLLKAEKEQIREVWLTDRGQEYLQTEYYPGEKDNSLVSLQLLKNYLQFLRKTLRQSAGSEMSAPLESSSPAEEIAPLEVSASEVSPVSPEPEPTSLPSDGEILRLIQELDQELGTENYLPIFHLRQRLQPPLSGSDLDQALYRLQRQDQIDLSSLVEAGHYTQEQLQAGIQQDSGSMLFFIIVNTES